MPPISPEPEGRKTKDSISHLKRDQPLFTTRRSVLSHQPPDFFTDSLNTSSIPIPSPTKENTRPGTFSKPRPKLGSRSLAASFQATSEANDENKRPSTSPSLGRRSTTYLPRIRPAQSDSRSLAKSPSRPPSRLPRAKTPSPERGRRPSIVSPSSSASSPPRGLAEAYQRITDEESLAQEDSIEGDMETLTYDYASQERSAELDRVRMQRIQEAVSPINLKASRQPLPPRVLSEELRDAKVRSKAIETSLPESDSESAISNSENLTGNFKEEVSQHAKDLARVNGARNSETKVFSKARSRNRVGVTVESLTRRNGSNESLSSAPGAGSTSSKGSNPSLNVPQQWARKARSGSDWLNRIHNKNGRLTGDTPKKNHANTTGSEGSDQMELLEEWVTTAKEDLNPSESDRPASRDSTPTAANQKQSIERVAEWEINDDDFTGRSLQVSDSPPIRTRNGSLLPILEREIDSLAKRAVTTSRLGEIREKTPEEHLARRVYSQSAEDLSKSGIESNRETLRQRRSSLKIPFKPFVDDKGYSSTSGAVLGSGGDPIPDSPVTIYRSTSDISSTDNGLGGNMDDDRRSVHRPMHERGDSRELLRKIARVSSQSPTSTKEGPSPASQQEMIPTDNVEPDEEPSGFSIGTDLSVHAAEEENHDGNNHLPDVNIERPAQETPRLSKSNADLKTPLVTGAWIETPLPTGSRGLPLPTPANLEDDKDFTVDGGDQSRKIAATDLIRKLNPTILSTRPKLNSQRQLKDTGPLLPKSALESILAAAKANPKPTSQRNRGTNSKSDSDELELGDSTMQSLEEILHDDPDRSTLASQPSSSPSFPNEDFPDDSEFEDSLLKSDHSEAESLTPGQRSRLSELTSYARQISRLGNVGPSIRDTKRRLASLEKAFSQTVSDLPAKSLEIQDGCDEAGEFHDFIWPCERCGCPGRRDLDTSHRIARYMNTVSISVPKLWRWQRDDWRPRLTWLGLVTLVWWAWWIGDWAACEIYCHPEFARKKTFGYGVDINSPRPPFVLFKVIGRLCRETSIIRPFYIFFSVLVRAVFSLLGYLVGFAFGGDGGGTGGGRTRQPVSRDPRIPRPNWGPDLSMMNDEYL
ncbi:hypothetical protein MMC29_007940 [Sticta canariensis]|nr:hypothetical protein [Sticta canariensis]